MKAVRPFIAVIVHAIVMTVTNIAFGLAIFVVDCIEREI
jgi:hypothetical protein